MSKEKLIETAVNWWADKISNRHHHDNGAGDDKASIMACFMADLMFNPIAEQQIDLFKEELRNRIRKSFDDGNKDVWLCTDYAPCRTLAESAEVAGINLLNFPFKTNMVINEDKVRVSDGYCQPYVEIGGDHE